VALLAVREVDPRSHCIPEDAKAQDLMAEAPRMWMQTRLDLLGIQLKKVEEK